MTDDVLSTIRALDTAARNGNFKAGSPEDVLFILYLRTYARDMLDAIQASREEVQRLEKRLQVDPGGSDRIDELEDALTQVREQLKKQQDFVAMVAAPLNIEGQEHAGIVKTARKMLGMPCQN